MIRVLIGDDHAILRRGLKEILVRELDGVTWGEAENGQQVLDEIQSHDWDLLILDITMPGRGGLDVLSTVKASGRSVRQAGPESGRVRLHEQGKCARRVDSSRSEAPGRWSVRESGTCRNARVGPEPG